MLQNITIKNTDTIERMCDLSLNLFVRNSGIVIESPKAIEHLRRGFAIKSHARYVPTISPMAVQKVSLKPPR